MELSYKENGSKQLFLGCILAVGQNKKGEYLATMKMIQIAIIFGFIVEKKLFDTIR